VSPKGAHVKTDYLKFNTIVVGFSEMVQLISLFTYVQDDQEPPV